jgi:hypothetical protein
MLQAGLKTALLPRRTVKIDIGMSIFCKCAK